MKSVNGWGWRHRWIALVAIVVATAPVLTTLLAPGNHDGSGGTGAQPWVTPLALPIPPPAAGGAAAGSSVPLWHTWQPPAGMPAAGTIGSVQIPATQSGFTARDAQVYLPPAALVSNAPALPFVLMMMGQPGSPDAAPIGGVLDQFAAAHDGLAPIVVVADQLGDPDVDSLCLDTTRYGNVQTYIEKDVIAWAQSHLHIETDRTDWTVAGFSNGGQCAISLASKYPDVWGNVISASGTPYEGIESEADVLAEVFGGDQEAYDATKPATVLAASNYPDTTAVFTVGADDDFIRANLKGLSDDARAAGMQTTYYEVPGEGHTTGALTDGLTRAFGVLYPRLGLERPR
jgi:enterochelin esterase-like enzyme